MCTRHENRSLVPRLPPCVATAIVSLVRNYPGIDPGRKTLPTANDSITGLEREAARRLNERGTQKQTDRGPVVGPRSVELVEAPQTLPGNA
jgi:hypothetical protein